MAHLLGSLPSAPPLVVDLLVDLMATLASYSITVRELKMVFAAMKAVNGKWVSAHFSNTKTRKIILTTLQSVMNSKLSKQRF